MLVAWFVSLMTIGQYVNPDPVWTLAADEPNLHGTPVTVEQAAVRAAHDSGLPVAVTFVGCDVNPAYLHGVDIMISDIYPAYQGAHWNVVQMARTQARQCLRVAHRYGVKLAFTLQAFAGGVEDWRCPTVRELRGMFRAVHVRGVSAVLFWRGQQDCPKLDSLIAEWRTV